MEPCDGELSDFIQSGKEKLALKQISWDQYQAQAASILANAAEHYAGAHALGILNRDIKEANIMTRAAEGVVSDFGTAARESEALVLASYAGTPIYSAPEAAACRFQKASDVWSFAIVVYSTLVGPIEYNPVMEAIIKDSGGGGDPERTISFLKKLASPVGNAELKAKYRDLAENGVHCEDDMLNEFFSAAFSIDPAKRPTMEKAYEILSLLAEEAKDRCF